MLGSSCSLRALVFARTVALTVAVLLAFAVLEPVAARASGCTNTWTNTKEGGSASWFEATNWSKGKVPSGEEEACITEPGTYTVVMTQTSTSGAVSVKSITVGGGTGTQSLVVGSSASFNASLTTTAGLASNAHGAITITNGDGAGNNVIVVGPVSNGGTFTSEPAHGGSRTLQGSLTNTGTLAINTATAFNGANTLNNEGTISLAEGKTLTVAKEGSVTNGSGGNIAATGSGQLLVSGGKFSESAGTTSGTKPVVVDDGALAYTGAGASSIALRGTSTLSGTSSPGQALSIESTAGENAQTTAGAGFTNGGSITLTNGDGTGNNATLVISGGTLLNSGALTSEPANGGSRTVQGSVRNTGSVAIDANTSFSGTKGLLTNEGALTVAEGKALTVSAEGAVTNGAGGSIAGGASGLLQLEPGTTFTEGAGTTSGTKPVIVRDGALVYTGAGASSIALHGSSSTLSGSLSVGQALSIESTAGENAQTTASASFTNAGSITLTNGDGTGNSATLVISAGTLLNSGTIATETAHGGSRTVQGSVRNTGSVAIGANTSFSGTKGLLTNEGALTVAEGKALTVSAEGAVTNGAGGSIAGGASGLLQLEPGTTFTEGAGTTSGTKPVIVRDGALVYTGAGASSIALHGSSSTLSGSLSVGQALSIESTAGENAQTTASASFTNAGSITLTNGDGTGNSATLVISAGTLLNSGTLTTEPLHGGSRTLAGSVTNTGTLAINANTSENGAKALLTNEGALTVAEGKALTVSAEGAVTNGAGGSIAGGASGLLQLEPATTFTEGAGTTSGTKPVVVRDGALKYTGSGASVIALHGSSSTVSGNIAKGQTLLVESTSGENAQTTAIAAFTNSGTITLTNGDGAGNNAVLAVPGAGLLNKNSIKVELAHGGIRQIEGILTNEKKLLLAQGVNLKIQGSFKQSKKGSIQTTIGGPVLGRITDSGTAMIEGKLTIKQAKTNPAKEGESLPLLTSSALTGTFSKVSGTKIKKTALSYVPTYSPTAVTLVVS